MINYSATVRDYFFRRQHVGKLDEKNSSVGVARLGENSFDDVLTLYLQFEKNKIVCAKYLAYGSVAMIAMGEFLCSQLMNMSIEALSIFTEQFILQKLSLPNLKIHVASLGVTAIQQAVKDYEQKQHAQT